MDPEAMGVALWRDRRSGRWGVDLRIPATRAGKRVRRLVGTKAEAEAVEADLLLKRREAAFPILRRPPEAPTFDAVAEAFLRDHAAHRRSPRTFESAVRVLRRTFGGQTLAQIDGPAVRAWMVRRREEGASNGTINRQRAVLGSMLTFAIDVLGWDGRHPLHRGTPGRVKPLPEAPPRDRYLTPDEAAKLIASCEPPFRQMVVVALETGLRLNELLTLRWTDIRDGAIRLRAEVCKSGRSRVVPIAPYAAAALASLPRDADLVFRNSYGRPLKRGGARYAWEKAIAASGLGPDVTIHVLRHTFASWYVLNGGDLYRLQKYLGHSTIALTQRYAHLSPGHLKEGARFIGTLALASLTAGNAGTTDPSGGRGRDVEGRVDTCGTFPLDYAAMEAHRGWCPARTSNPLGAGGTRLRWVRFPHASARLSLSPGRP